MSHQYASLADRCRALHTRAERLFAASGGKFMNDYRRILIDEAAKDFVADGLDVWLSTQGHWGYFAPKGDEATAAVTYFQAANPGSWLEFTICHRPVNRGEGHLTGTGWRFDVERGGTDLPPEWVTLCRLQAPSWIGAATRRTTVKDLLTDSFAGINLTHYKRVTSTSPGLNSDLPQETSTCQS